MISLFQIVKKIEDYFNAHEQVKKVGFDFEEQLENFATVNEKYPLIFISPLSNNYTDNVNTFSLEVRCLDVIQKDRANILTILSDTGAILNDFSLYANLGIDEEIEVSNVSLNPLNNDILDYCAGWVMSIDLTVASYCQEDAPQNI